MNQGLLEEWGQWVGNKYYALEIVQHPLRARMCGFGDKDRRPLAPAAVAKMIIRRQDSSIVDEDETDCSFFIVTVDLWSADGKQQNNLVLHPTPVDRLTPSIPPPKSHKGNSTSGSAPTLHTTSASGDHVAVEQASPAPAQRYRPDDQQPNISTAISSSSPSYTNYASQEAHGPDNTSYPPQGSPYRPPPNANQHPWSYSAPPPDRNFDSSMHSFHNRSSNSDGVGNWQSQAEVYREWGSSGDGNNNNNNNNNYPPVHNAYDQQTVDQASKTPSTATSDGRVVKAPWTQSNAYCSTTAQDTDDAEHVASYGHGPFQHELSSTSSYTPYTQGSPSNHSTTLSVAGLPRHGFTRALVGPLSANACRLLDEHSNPGIFFLFQDLSVRIEGTYRLRMRLMNVGAPPAPETGAHRIHNDTSPILAQVYTAPFTVFSAKRFPGVPDTTALSIALGNQGQKLPLRNRNGSATKRRRRGNVESDNDSE